jgi:hypothetical protein
MHTRKRYALSQEEYEREWSIWFRSYLFGESSTSEALMERPTSPLHNADERSPHFSPTSPQSQSPDVGSPTNALTTHYDVAKSYQCTVCFKAYPRMALAEGCKNRHCQAKPYICTKKCGDENWYDTSAFLCLSIS